MGIGWITAFKVIPWGDVIAAAPAVAQGAKKLWTTVRNRNPEEADDAPPAGSAESRLRALEARMAELARQNAASSELIQSLAEQNSRLVEAVEILRVRTRALLVLCAIFLASALVLGFWLLLR
jgi:hypothetical protein